VKQKWELSQVKLVLITNASMFHRPHVRSGLEILQANQGEIWAKLEAGTEDYYRLVERTTIPFNRILENLRWAASRWPIVIQALFMQIHGQGPSQDELLAFCERLQEILQAGGSIRHVQVYTVARRPAESYVTPLPDQQVDSIAAMVREKTGVPTEVFYGTSQDG
jgi:wyosine [tRNA(Phe)-imidazoG37] synthetase (radical SAM superfamily)